MKTYYQMDKIPTGCQLIETHSHTLPATQCSDLEYKELIDMYANEGYSGLFITDHYGIEFDTQNRFFYSNPQYPFSCFYPDVYHYATQKNIQVFYGFEIKFHPSIPSPYDNVEFLVYGASPDFLEKHPKIYLCDNISHGLDNLKNALTDSYGNARLIIQDHPFRNRTGILHHKAIDGIEQYNGTETGRSLLYPGLRLSGSDAHLPKHCCHNAVLLHNWDYTLSDFLYKLKSKEYCLYAHRNK